MTDDPYLWLEDVTGERALDWVRERNAATLSELTGSPRFEQLRTGALEVLDADDRIPFVRRRGEYLYNFWQDAAHPKGLWRRTTLEQYRTADPAWEVLLDVDALAKAEDENWVWKGAQVRYPQYDRALVELSRGGADAVVIREFDLPTLAFVADGFVLEEAKSDVSWIDLDTIYVGTDFGEGSLTTSGYPRVVKQWRRGTPLTQATTVFEGKPDDVSVNVRHDSTPGYSRAFITRSPDFYTSEVHLRRTDGTLVRIEVPDDASTSIDWDRLLIELRSPWTVGETTYQAGSLLATGFDAYLAGERTLTVLFEPDEHSSLDYFSWTRDHLLLATLRDVTSVIEVLTPTEDGWRREPLAGVPEVGAAAIGGTDPDNTNEYLLTVSGFTQPSTLLRGVVGEPMETLKQAPAFFDASGLSVRQRFATSKDGTTVPYFVVGRSDAPAGPTLLYGYGGYEISLTPAYGGVVGRSWLARGGTYVVANIRGGGEYGPRWHQAALRENRPRAYEDFAAVAQNLVTTGVTTPAQLGIQGGSNGGLLMGVMLTRYPELFGAVVCQVPVLDMRRYHLLLAGASWIAEWGDPDDPADWAFLEQYSPYHNIHGVQSGQTYPPVLITTSTRDDRVHPAHARKMVARLRELGHQPRYYENIEGGHGGAADNDQAAFKSALAYEFLWRELG